jgi:transcription elongation factor Elf1
MKRSKLDNHSEQDRRHRTFVETQNTCPLCNSQLTIRVESYLEGFNLREEASCPKCQVLARVKDHKMQ